MKDIPSSQVSLNFNSHSEGNIGGMGLVRGLREVDGCWLKKGDSPALSDSTASLTSLPPPAPSLIPHPSLPVPSCPSLLCPLEVLVLVDNCNCT